MKRPGRDAGFTLLEILVALTVLGFLMAALAGGVRFGLTSYSRQTAGVDAQGDLDATDRALAGLIGRMDPGTAVVALDVFGTSGSLDFTTDLPEGVADGASRHADVRLTVDGAHRLILRWTPHVHAVRLAPAPTPETAVLLTGVDRLQLEYFRTATAQAAGGWVTSWRDRRPPALVRIHIGFPAGDARHWPDLIAVPMREQPQ